MYIVQFNAYYTRDSVRKGVKFSNGSFAGGYVLRSPIINWDTGDICNSLDEVKSAVSILWSREYKGFYKDVCIKYLGSVVFEHKNYDLKVFKGVTYFKSTKKQKQ